MYSKIKGYRHTRLSTRFCNETKLQISRNRPPQENTLRTWDGPNPRYLLRERENGSDLPGRVKSCLGEVVLGRMVCVCPDQCVTTCT
ncbi:hypothetical protein GDO86_003223 [Hymenochirus boettgeri]|uniref:Uncharacterized protein n=1 Tax=Hymenochirus boettgeri TaxID=247094 RepID=A0A8T2K2M1_9PIPI|nr:hypothetical protein GDO86_003223 [Hymenochirus boettgeri]